MYILDINEQLSTRLNFLMSCIWKQTIVRYYSNLK